MTGQAVARIARQVKAEILKDAVLKSSRIDVTTTEGVVRLSGTVESEEGRDKAAEIARSAENVKSVENGLVVKDSR